MSFKDELLKLRKRIIGIGEKDESLIVPSNYIKSKYSSSIDLDDKIDNFIDWYFQNMVKGHYTDVGEYSKPRKMRNFIEKMAVWYELRYPDYEINRLMPGSAQEQIDINDVMFKNNPYINNLLDEDADTRELDWDEFFNANAFIKSLPWEERYLFTKPRHRDSVCLNSNSINAYLYLTKNGIVRKAQDIETFTNSVIKDEELEGLSVRKVVEIFKEKGIKLPENNSLEETIRSADNKIYQKEEMLNCVMYRIIERGGTRMGPRRAFLFAKEFGRNIDIPMMYAVDYSDPGLRRFINEYIKAGGSKDLECYVGYFSRTSKKEKLDTISIQELILPENNNSKITFTPEEYELHQRLVNVLASQIDQDVVRKEEVKRLRLERKLEKSRINKG